MEPFWRKKVKTRCKISDDLNVIGIMSQTRYNKKRMSAVDFSMVKDTPGDFMNYGYGKRPVARYYDCRFCKKECKEPWDLRRHFKQAHVENDSKVLQQS